MRVHVEEERCESHSLCEVICPEVFRLDDYGVAHVLIEYPGEELRAAVEESVRACPEAAIIIYEDEKS
jgi:ferredoxin